MRAAVGNTLSGANQQGESALTGAVACLAILQLPFLGLHMFLLGNAAFPTCLQTDAFLPVACGTVQMQESNLWQHCFRSQGTMSRVAAAKEDSTVWMHASSMRTTVGNTLSGPNQQHESALTCGNTVLGPNGQ